MKTEYHEDTHATVVSFRAGKAYDFGAPAPHWYYSVVYRWSECTQTYWVHAVRLAGVGASVDQTSHETRTASWQDVKDCLDYLKELEMHYKAVYGE